MPEVPSGDTKVAIDWLTSLHPGGPWFLYASGLEEKPSFSCQRFTETQLEQMWQWVESRQQTHNMYYSLNVPQLNVKKHPKKEEITHLVCLHFDLDLPKTGPRAAPTPENFQLLLDRVNALTIPPPVLVYSGGGYQGLWPLERRLDARAYGDQVEQANQGVEKALQGDHCWNINRILRLPGTINVPDARKLSKNPLREPALATVIRADWSATWSIERHAVPKMRPDFVDPSRAHWDDAEPEEDDFVAADKPHSLETLPPRLKRAIVTGDASAYGDNRSALVFYVLCGLVRRGWADSEMIPFILDEKYGLSAHCRSKSNPERTATRQLERARGAVARDWVKTEGGQILPNHPANIRKGLDQLGARFSLNVFSNQPYINGIGPPRPLDDAELRHLRVHAFPNAHNFVPSKDIWTDVLLDLAWQASYHPVVDYLADAQERWDGEPRLSRWLVEYGKVQEREPRPEDNLEDQEKVIKFNRYLEAISRMMLVAAVRRVRQPGCQFQEMCVFVNTTQGTNKSSALAALSPNPEWFIDSLPLHSRDQEVIEKLSGKWIVEFAELAGMRNSDVESLKGFLGRSTDHARMAYDRFVKHPMRQCIFFGSTNEPAFLRDTQDRRFWPVHPGYFDVESLVRDRDQLWGEAAAAEAAGESIRLDPDLWDAAAEVQEEHRIGDPWVPILEMALGDLTGKISTPEAFNILGKPGHQRSNEDSRRFGSAMRQLGWERVKSRIYGKVSWCYARGTDEERAVQLYSIPDPIDPTKTIVEPIPDRYEPGLHDADDSIPF